MIFVATIINIEYTNADDVCFIKLNGIGGDTIESIEKREEKEESEESEGGEEKKKDSLLIRMYIKNELLEPKKNDKLEFTFEEIPLDATVDSIKISEDYDLCFCGTVCKLINKNTYISNGGLMFHINRLLGPDGTQYFTKIKKL